MQDDVFQRKRKDDDDLHVDVTSMIDVVFLLLIFFMVTSTMSQQDDAEVPEAVHGRGVDVVMSTIITILANPNGEPKMLIGDGVGSPEAKSLDDVKEAIEQGIREGRPEVIVKAEKTVPNSAVVAVAKVVAQVEGTSLHFGIKEKD